jgi:hypothetical protein
MDETIGCSGVGGNQQVTTQAAPVQSNDDDDILEQFDSDQFNPYIDSIGTWASSDMKADSNFSWEYNMEG